MNSITLDGISYDVTQFSSGVQQAVAIYNQFQQDLQKAQLEVIKSQAALQSVGLADAQSRQARAAHRHPA